MSCATSIGAHVFITTYLLFVTGCLAQKVYFDCGAKVDVVDVQGLILSPGFPYNYSSGIHCVWQFFVPVDYQLILEMFDFDVFESHESATQHAAATASDFLGELADDGTLAPSRFVEDELLAKDRNGLSEASISKGVQSSYSDGVKDVALQEELTKAEVAQASDSAKRSRNKGPSDTRSTPPSPRLLIPVAQPPGGEYSASSPTFSSPISHPKQGLRPSPSPHPGGAEEGATLTPPPYSSTAAVSPETQQSVLDTCPHDVLYISDLIAFSSRFCGANRPPSSELVFGSSQEMVEVIMELITTTHWGRGFALLFHYHNRSAPGGDRRVYAQAAGKTDALLAAVSGAVLFAMILASTLCMVFRPKLCPKRANSSLSSNSEVTERAQNGAADMSELRVVTADEAELEVSDDAGRVNRSPSLSHGRTHRVGAGGLVSQNAELELSPGGLMTELDLGTDEVFVASSNPGHISLPLSPNTQRERFLRYSDTGAVPPTDWPSPDPGASSRGLAPPKDGGSGCGRPRPRAWSVRTFQDLLLPLPQLHKKWCSWNSSSPFTKLVDTTPPSLAAEGCAEDGRKVFSEAHLPGKVDTSATSDGAASNASYPLTQSAHRQRRLNSTSNLRRSLFTGACFSLLTGTNGDPSRVPTGAARPAQAPASKSGPGAPSFPPGQLQDESSQAGEYDPAGEGDRVGVPSVFAISEEEDRQPLVPAEHLGQASSSSPPAPLLNGLAGGSGEGAGGPPQCQGNNPHPLKARPHPWRPCGRWGESGGGPGGSAVTLPTQPAPVQLPPTRSPPLCAARSSTSVGLSAAPTERL